MIKKIDEIIESLDEKDVEGHIWWGKFRDFVAIVTESEPSPKEMTSEERIDMANKSLKINYPNSSGEFCSTWVDGYMQALRDISITPSFEQDALKDKTYLYSDGFLKQITVVNLYKVANRNQWVEGKEYDENDFRLKMVQVSEAETNGVDYNGTDQFEKQAFRI